MLHKLNIKNFTVFSDNKFEFSPGINMIIGENGTGKSHLLYLAYTIDYVWREALQIYLSEHKIKDKESWQRDLAEKLKRVFRPQRLGRLCRSKNKQRAEITMIPFLAELATSFSFYVTAKEKVKLEQLPSFKSLQGIDKLANSVFFPTKEVLSFYPGFIRAYEEREIAFSAIDYDLCKNLTAAPLKGKPFQKISSLVAPLEEILQGKLVLEFNNFYLLSNEYGKMEISLIPEGLRKIAMLSYLISNGGLTSGSTLFWDEPELNLNAKLQVKLVDTLVALAKAGIQIILTTHDLFLMKELSLRVEAGETKIKFIELLHHNAEQQVIQGDDLTDLFKLVSLQAALDQGDRGQEIYYQEMQAQ